MKRLAAILVLVMIVISGTSTEASADSYYDRKVSLFELLPISDGDVVFLGNSITDGGEFQELFGDCRVKNRGINSDVISGVDRRLNQILRGRPAKIFLLIGINDVSHDLPAEKIADDYRNLVRKIRTESPGTKLYLQSIMPVNNSFGRYKRLAGKESVIEEVNTKIMWIASDCGAHYIDLWNVLADADGKLKAEYTNDGLHLTGAGYVAWAEALRQYIE